LDSLAGVAPAQSTSAAAVTPLPPVSPNVNWREEVAGIHKTLEAVEDRVRLIKEALNALD